jgi:hypothetical protein
MVHVLLSQHPSEATSRRCWCGLDNAAKNILTSVLLGLPRWELVLPGLQEAVFNAVYEWRDRVCREEDEGTGYVLPKAHLIILGQNMPGRQRALPSSGNIA